MMNFIHVFNEICWFITFLIYIPFMVYFGIAWFVDWRKSYKEFKMFKASKQEEEWIEMIRKPKE